MAKTSGKSALSAKKAAKGKSKAASSKVTTKAKPAAKAAAKVKPAAKRGVPASPRPLPGAKPGELHTLLDFLRYAVSRFIAAELVFAHGTTDPVSEAAFLIGEALHLAPEHVEAFAQARVTAAEAGKLLDLIERRVATRQPAAYLVNKVYMRGLSFYVDDRVIVPRSFVGELLTSHFGHPEDGDCAALIGDPDAVENVLDLCTGSGCLAILAARHFANARIDAVDLSKDALAVAARNVAEHGLDDRITLHQGDLFAPLAGMAYDLIISNPPYVDAEGMAGLPPECRAEPAMAFDGGPDGIDIVRRILAGARAHLQPHGGLLCEVGRAGDAVSEAFPELPLLWLDTEDSEGEVFWIAAADL